MDTPFCRRSNTPSTRAFPWLVAWGALLAGSLVCKDGHAGPIAEDLRQAELLDSKIGLTWVRVEAAGGYSLVSPALIDGGSSGLANKHISGGLWSASVTGKALAFSLTARVRNHQSAELSLFWIDGSLSYRPRIGAWEPYVGLSGGYVFSTKASQGLLADGVAAAGSQVDLSLRGASVGVVGGFDYYLTTRLSLGVSVSQDFLFLKRAAVATPTTGSPVPLGSPLYQGSGNAVGLSTSAMGTIQVHF